MSDKDKVEPYIDSNGKTWKKGFNTEEYRNEWCSENLLDQGAQDKIKQLEARNNYLIDQVVRLKAQIDILMKIIKEK